MTQSDRELLLKDLSARLTYKPVCHAGEINHDGELYFINTIYNIVALTSDKAAGKFETCPVVDVKPYLRPLSSMTKEEKEEYICLSDLVVVDGVFVSSYETFDWLNKHHFDYRGLIEKGLALKAPKSIYKAYEYQTKMA